MKINILHEPEHKKYDTGTIIKYNNETCLLMDNLIHTLDKNIIKVADKEYRSYGEFSLSTFLCERLLNWNIQIKGVCYSLRFYVPNKMLDRKNGRKNLKIKLAYDNFLEIYYILVANKYYHYYIYDFMETEYSFFEEKEYNDNYNYLLGDIYYSKLNMSLREFSEKKDFKNRKLKYRDVG